MTVACEQETTLGEGYVSGEISTLFNTVHDATMIAGDRGCRLWGLSLFHYERAAGLRDERGRRRGHAVFTPFETELTAHRLHEALLSGNVLGTFSDCLHSECLHTSCGVQVCTVHIPPHET